MKNRADRADKFYFKNIRGKKSLLTGYIKEVEKMCSKCPIYRKESKIEKINCSREAVR
jgi:hypothetical protein